MLLDISQNFYDEKFTVKITTSAPPKIDSLNMILQSQVIVEKVEDNYKVTFENVSADDVKELTDNKNKIFRKSADREKFLRAFSQVNIVPHREQSLAERGVKFSIPQLCLDFGDGLEVARREDFFPEEGWSLTDTQDYFLPLSKVESDIKFYEIDLHSNKLTEKLLLDDTQSLFMGKTNWTQSELIGWLADKITDRFITPEDFAEFTRCTLNQLTNEKHFSLEELVRVRFSIRRLLEEKIEILKDDAYKQNWQIVLFSSESPKVCVEKNIAFTFSQSIYPAKKFYQGSVRFNKHFYSAVGDMNLEEVLCAQYIDANPNVETWIRNIERKPEFSFWLPTHKDKFYPDFVVKLKDGTFATIEYKGEIYKTTDDSKEKNLLGNIWADKSHGLCKFLMAVKLDDDGRNLSTQINEFLA